MSKYLLKGGTLINEGRKQTADLRIRNGRIETIAASLSADPGEEVLDCGGKWIIPGLIDDQVHFREPGLTHKATIGSESKAALAGGVTSYMEMPNTKPTTTDAAQLDWKRNVASQSSWVNFAFFFGATNDNLEDVLRVDPSKTCGIKIFMGSSTGNMLVDSPSVLERVFAGTPLVIATHCEDEARIRQRTEAAFARFGERVPMDQHPIIRDAEACLLSSQLAVGLARKHGSNLHVLHISTAIETQLFEPGPMAGKKITSEACVHHLWYSDADYARKGGLIKCNPAIKTAEDRAAIRKAVEEGRIDIIATDHAPHTWEEKQEWYRNCPSGLPLVQHSLPMMLKMIGQGWLSPEQMVEKMCHNPALRFQVQERGFLREGYHADVVVVDPSRKWTVAKEQLLYHCGWSPLEGEEFVGENVLTFVNGRLAYQEGNFLPFVAGEALSFHRS